MAVAGAKGSMGGNLPETLFGYDVISRIGQGAASSVYAVTDSSGQVFALKHVICKTEKDERFINQLRNEYEMGLKLQHPVLRKVIDFKTPPRKLFGSKIEEAALILEWIDGNPMTDEHVPRDLPTLLSVFIQAATGLAAMHRLNLVHCDFKPGNLIIARDEVRLIDFGQTCPVGTIKERVQGTKDFMSPEQAVCRPVETTADVYGFGASLYWALTATRVPTYLNVAKDDREIVKRQLFPTPDELRPGLPMAVSDLVMRCLSYKASARPANILPVLETLRANTPTLTIKRGHLSRPTPKKRRVTDWGLGNVKRISIPSEDPSENPPTSVA